MLIQVLIQYISTLLCEYFNYSAKIEMYRNL